MGAERLVDTASHIADGAAVDWAALRDADSDALLDELSVIERIATAHRKLHLLLPEADAPENGSRWGHLEIVEEVGRGAFGVVYRAIDTTLHREVALKLYRDRRDSAALIDEGRRLARIDHPNVVRVYGADVVDGRAGLWMELVRGTPLDTLVLQSGPRSARESALVGCEIARGLAAVHAAGLIHRDVKAANVLREAGGRFLLMDLGASGAQSAPLPSGSLAGTPLYMAPEVIEGTPATAATDLYSLGVLLFFLSTGVFPVDARTLADLRQRHGARDRRTLADVRPDLPTSFTRVVERAIDPEPARRFRTAGEFAQALQDVAGTAAPRRTWLPAWALGAAAVLAIAVVAWMLWLRPTAAPVDLGMSLAVLPIRNLTGDPGQAHVADALTEVLAANLGRLPGLSVLSSAATASFRGSLEHATAIGRKLGVRYVMTGAVAVANGRWRIAVQLVDPNTNRTIWGEDLTRDEPDVFAAQTEIAQLVAARLQLGGGAAVGPKLIRLDPKAQDAYFRGLASVNVAPTGGLADAAAAFEEAVRIEPAFASGWAELAIARLRLISRADPREQQRRIDEVRIAALKALALDAAQPSAYIALGTLQFYYDWDFAAADQSLLKALEVSPSNATARQRRAMLLAALGRTDDAIALCLESQALEPLVPIRSSTLGIAYYYDRDYANAALAMQRSLSVATGFAPGHFGLGRVRAAQGRYQEAIREIGRSLESAAHPPYEIELARVLAQANRRDEANVIVARLEAAPTRGYEIDNLAYIAAVEGRMDDAFRLLDEAILQRSPNLLWLAVDPRADPLRDDPRFSSVLVRIGLQK